MVKELNELKNQYMPCQMNNYKHADKEEERIFKSLMKAIDVLERYEKVAGVMPEKKRCPVKFPDTADFRNGYIHGRDSGITDCTLAITKKLEGLGNVINVFQMPSSVNPESNPVIYSEDFCKLAKSIRDMITGGGR